MTAAAIDTRDCVTRMTAVGMPEPQAEVLGEMLADSQVGISKKAVLDAVEKLGRSIDKRFVALEERFDKRLVALEERFDKRFVALEERFDKRFVALEERFVALENRFVTLEGRVDQHGDLLQQHSDALARIESLIGKVLDGQSILHQNDMELKRRLDERR